MNDPTASPQTTNVTDSAPRAPIKVKRTFWQWVWTIVVIVLGAFIGFILAEIVGLMTGLIPLSLC